jgi:cytochrome P450
MEIVGPEAVVAALTSADLIVPPAPPSDGPAGLAWLRASVARFHSGADHVRLRSHLTAALERADPDRLRAIARRRTAELLAGATEVDLMAVAYAVPAAALAEVLGLADPGGDVAVVARLYLTGPTDGESTGAEDAAVARLVANAGGRADEETAALVALLVQAYGATAALIGNAFLGGGDVARTVHTDPPTLATRRLATVDTMAGGVHIGAGEVVRVDLASADLTFGAGPHACPGAAQAKALAEGVLHAMTGATLAEEAVEYLPVRNVKAPTRLRVRLPHG